jgi:glycosyltransferase involved in cell wall biosynthesis
MAGRRFIHAVNIHQGGGRSLLNALLKSVEGHIFLLVDERMPLFDEMSKNVIIKRVKPSIKQRLLAEKWLYNEVLDDDLVLCFGNLPPLFKLRGYVTVFLQNRYLAEDVSLNQFPLRIRVRILIERFWLFNRLMNVDEFVVQTITMKRLMDAKLKEAVTVRELPFIENSSYYLRCLPRLDKSKNNDFDFIYVASGEPHKNHSNLIKAWCLLAEDGLFPSLCLTLDSILFSELCRFVDAKRIQHRLKIFNLGNLPHHEVLELYSKSGAAIYPSKFESLGLPLVEARQMGLPVLASELDYVRDVLDPEQVFDPDSPMSIARAVKRFMGEEEKPLPLLNASHFLATVFKKDIQ